GKARESALRFGSAQGKGIPANMVDIGDWAKQVATLEPSVAPSADAAASALKASVVAITSGRANVASTGLSIYFPDKGQYSQRKDAYVALEEVAWWSTFLGQTFDARNPHAPTFTNTDKTGQVVSKDDQGITIAGQLDKGTAASVVDSTV